MLIVFRSVSLVLALLGRILSPSCSKMAPRWPNIGQHSANIASKSRPRTPKNLQKCCTIIVFLVFAIFGKIAPKIQKRSPRCSQKCAKLAILASKLAILGTSWRQVGQLSAILAATCPILAPSCAPTDLQIKPQTRPKSHLGPSWRQEGRPGAPNHPWSSNFQGFDLNLDSIFDHIFEHIFIIFLRFLLQFPAAGLARWRLGARSALVLLSYNFIQV